jgi:hypothetical protein
MYSSYGFDLGLALKKPKDIRHERKRKHGIQHVPQIHSQRFTRSISYFVEHVYTQNACNYTVQVFKLVYLLLTYSQSL